MADVANEPRGDDSIAELCRREKIAHEHDYCGTAAIDDKNGVRVTSAGRERAELRVQLGYGAEQMGPEEGEERGRVTYCERVGENLKAK